MKLQRFNEYVNNTINDNRVAFNDNEIKYMNASGDLYIDFDKKTYFNFRYVEKLSTNEYLVVTDNIKCSTIQSLIKYCNNSWINETIWFNNLLKNSTIKTDNENQNFQYLYHNGELWAFYKKSDINVDNFVIKNGGYWDKLPARYYLEDVLFFQNRLKQYYNEDISVSRWGNDSYIAIQNKLKDSSLNESNTQETIVEIPFNKNEIKYMQDTSLLKIVENHLFDRKMYFLNCRHVQKLDSKEYRVAIDDIICSTIQSLVKYTKNTFNKNAAWFDDLLIHSKHKLSETYGPNRVYWFYNDKLWAIQYTKDKEFMMLDNMEYYRENMSKYEFDEVELFYLDRLTKVAYLKKYQVSWLNENATRQIEKDIKNEKYID